MRSRNLVVLSAVVAILAVAIVGTVAFGIYAGLTAGQHKTTQPGAVVTGTAPEGLTAARDATNTAAAPAIGAAVADSAPGSSAIAQPAPGFYPGTPPFGNGGATADGISTWGIAYRQGSDPAAQPDAALVKAAYQDAEKKASDLASATGNRLGKLVAMTDYNSTQPYFKPCVYTGGPAIQKPAAGGATGSSGGGASSGSAGVAIAPAPCQATSNSYYVVVWVYVRHAIG